MLASIEPVHHPESRLGRDRRPRYRHAEMSGKSRGRRDEILDRLLEVRLHSLARNPVDHLRDGRISAGQISRRAERIG